MLLDLYIGILIVIFPQHSYLKYNTQIKIYSIEGIEVLETAYKDKIDVSSFAPGVYYVKVRNSVLRFVKI